jgi:hypothetical protein
MWQDMALLMASEARLYRQSLQLSPNVRFRSESLETRENSCSSLEFKESESEEEDDVKYQTIMRQKNVFLQKLVLRIILGAINASLPGLGIVIFPLLLCRRGLMPWLGVLLASYEILFLINTIVVAQWALTRKPASGVRQLLLQASIFAVMGFGLLFFAVFSKEQILFVVLPLLGVSSSLQTSLLAGLDEPREGQDSSPDDSPGVEDSRELVTLTSDVLYWQYMSFFGPALGILCGLAGPRVAPVLVAVLGTGLSVIMLVLASVVACLRPLAVPRSPSHDSTVSPTTRTSTAPTVSLTKATSRCNATAGWLFNVAGVVFWALFYGGLVTLFFASPSLDTSLHGGYSTVLTPYLIGAAVTYAATYDFWCWMDCRWTARYRCCSVVDLVYLRLFIAALSLLAALLVLLVHVAIRRAPSHPSLYASGFLYGIAGQLFLPTYERLSLRAHAAPGSGRSSRSVRDFHTALTTCIASLHVSASSGRLVGVLIMGSLVGTATVSEGREGTGGPGACVLSFQSPSSASKALLSTQTALAFLLIVSLGSCAYYESYGDGQRGSMRQSTISAFLLATWSRQHPGREPVRQTLPLALTEEGCGPEGKEGSM